MAVTFDTIVAVDWSGGNQKPALPSADAIWACVNRYGKTEKPLYFRNRQLVEFWLRSLLSDELKLGRRVMVGLDFPFGYPNGFAKTVTGQDDPLAFWNWLDDHIADTPTANNRFDVAGALNARFDGIGPFWGNGLARDIEDLPRRGSTRTCTDFADRRDVEQKASGAFSVWQLSGAGAVGSQVLMGLPVLQRLRRKFPTDIAVWPFEPLDRPVAFVEIWPSFYNDQLKSGPYDSWIKDAAQVHMMATLIAEMAPEELAEALDVPATPEGWIFGVAP